MRLVLIFVAAALCLSAAEQVVLTSGFRLRVDRHEQAGGSMRLFTATGEIQVPAASIQSIEAEEYVPPPPAPVETPVPAAPPAPAQQAPADPKQLLDKAAGKYGLPPEFLHSVARVESAYNPRAVSPKGAIGVMQLMPETAARLSADPNNVEQNIDAGARHLRDLLVRYDGSAHRALSAYNAGEGAVDRYGGVPPYAETQLYVDKVLRTYQRLSEQRPADSR
ncbi:MAG: lytic transglycosylase domain-containing protein [Bryobacteraceae bacterium]